MSVNKVLLLGRLGKDPELKNINGTAICNLSVATSKSWKDDGGEKQEKTEWHRIVAFRKTAELAAKYLTKGSEAFIEGELQTRSYEVEGVKKYSTEIVASSIQFIGGSKSAATTGADTTTTAPDTSEVPF